MIIEAAGWGFPFYAGFQSYSQLAEGWGADAAKTISNNLTWQVYLGGTQEPEHLDRVSALGGDEDCRDRDAADVHPVPDDLLQQGEVLVKGRACRAFVGRIGKAEDHPLFEQAALARGRLRPALPYRRREAVTAASRGRSRGEAAADRHARPEPPRAPRAA